MGKNIYFHFFDRELRQSVGACIPEKSIIGAINSSILVTDGFLYMPLSNLFESNEEYPNAARLLLRLIKEGLLLPASSHNDYAEFIASRKLIYAHDRTRYPMYFETIPFDSVQLTKIEGSTTKILQDHLHEYFEYPQLFQAEDKKEVRDALSAALYESEVNGKAVTYSLFAPAVQERMSERGALLAGPAIRHSISEAYTRRYIDQLDGSIVTGITGLAHYDYLAESIIDTNMNLMREVLFFAGVDVEESSSFDVLLAARYSESFVMLFNAYRAIVDGYRNAYNVRFSHLTVRGAIKEISRCVYDSRRDVDVARPKSVAESFIEYEGLMRKKGLVMVDAGESRKERCALIVLVTDAEIRAFMDVAKSFGISCESRRSDSKMPHWELKGLNFPAYAVLSEPGTATVGGAMSTINSSMNRFKPDIVIAGGIGFGIASDKRSIGDVMVSKQVWCYEPAKELKGKTLSRGDKVSADPDLIRRFRMAAIDVEDFAVHSGLMASGEKLKNSKEAIGSLIEAEPEIIGGDMEAAGLASACREGNVAWIVVKGISDWGFDKEDTNQVLAARNAFNLIFKVLGSMNG